MEFKRDEFVKDINRKLSSDRITVKEMSEDLDISKGTIEGWLYKKYNSLELMNYMKICKWLSKYPEDYIEGYEV